MKRTLSLLLLLFSTIGVALSQTDSTKAIPRSLFEDYEIVIGEEYPYEDYNAQYVTSGNVKQFQSPDWTEIQFEGILWDTFIVNTIQDKVLSIGFSYERFTYGSEEFKKQYRVLQKRLTKKYGDPEKYTEPGIENESLLWTDGETGLMLSVVIDPQNKSRLYMEYIDVELSELPKEDISGY